MKSLLRLLPLAPLALAGACTFNLRAAADVPQINTSAARLPGTVAVYIPAATRELSDTVLEPTGCWGLPKMVPQPYGQVFEDTLRGILSQYFDKVETVPSLPAPSDARLVLEASLSRVSLRFACPASPGFFGTATGSLRVLGPDGTERWRSFKTVHRNELPLPMFSMKPYTKIIPGAISGLVSSWASELSMAPFARGEGALPAAGSYVPPAAAAEPEASSPAPYTAKKKTRASTRMAVEPSAEPAAVAAPASAAAASAQPAPAPAAAPEPAPEPVKVYKPDASWDDQLLP